MPYRVAESGCWIWTGYTVKGYGQVGGRPAHRVAYEREHGQIPAGMEVDHLCRVPLCVNPDHLEPVTRAENMRRRAAARAACINGHPFDEANTYVAPGERKRICRACNRARAQRYRTARAGR